MSDFIITLYPEVLKFLLDEGIPDRQSGEAAEISIGAP
jgi:hypothetical protein